ncbi:MAG: phosphodiester glycosidase family protein [Clostridia bacterium]|nr:phosphodiester glycosidase family protein [Clostridia bacterium]
MRKLLAVILATVLLGLSACGGGESMGVRHPQLGAEISRGADGSGVLPEYAEVTEDMAAAALYAVSDSFALDKDEMLDTGMWLRQLVFGESKAYILRVELEKYSLMASTPYGIAPDGTMQSLRGQAAILAQGGTAVVGGIGANRINGADSAPIGAVVKNGTTLYNVKGNDGSVYFGLYEDGGAFACSYEEYGTIYRNKVTELVSAPHLIVKDGVAVPVAGSVYQTPVCYTGAGFSADRQTVCFVYAENIEMATLSSLLITSGCSVGVCFDYGEALGMLCGDGVFGNRASVGPALFAVRK